MENRHDYMQVFRLRIENSVKSIKERQKHWELAKVTPTDESVPIATSFKSIIKKAINSNK